MATRSIEWISDGSMVYLCCLNLTCGVKVKGGVVSREMDSSRVVVVVDAQLQ